MASAKKLPSGSWRVNLFIGKDENGKRKYKSFTADTKKEAEFLAAQYNQKKIDVVRDNITLGEAADSYIASKSHTLSPSTLRSYKSIRKNNVKALMNTKLKDITPEMVQKAMDEFAGTHKPKTCRNVHNFISAVLEQRDVGIKLKTSLPQKERNDIFVPDNELIEQIAKAAEGHDIEIPFLLASQCGLRASEISGLEKKHIYTDHISIKQARVKGDNGDVIKVPKSYAGTRDVPISKELYDVLITHLDGDRVCPMTSLEISRMWITFRDKIGLPEDCNFHALRHHFASRCLLLGMPQKYTAELMGHSSTDMIERVYQHTFESAMAEFAEKLRKQNSEFMQHKMQHKKS